MCACVMVFGEKNLAPGDFCKKVRQVKDFFGPPALILNATAGFLQINET